MSSGGVGGAGAGGVRRDDQVDGTARVGEGGGDAAAAPDASGGGARRAATAARPRSVGFNSQMLDVQQQAAGGAGTSQRADVQRWLAQVKGDPGADSWKPGPADKALIRELQKLSPQELEGAMGGLEWSDQQKIWDASRKVAGPHAKITDSMFNGMVQEHKQEQKTMDPTYVRHIANLSAPEFRDWYNKSTPLERRQLIQRVQQDGSQIFAKNPAQETAFRDHYDGVVEENNQGWAADHFKHMSEQEITDDIAQTALSPQGRAAVIENLRLLEANPKATAAAEKYERALQAAMQKQQQNQYAPGGHLPLLDRFALADDVAGLEGPGAAEAKGHFIEMMYHNEKNPPARVVENILRSDKTGGTLDVLEGSSMRSVGLLNRALTDIAHVHAKDPKEAAEAMSDILAPFAARVAQASMAKPYDKEKFEASSNELGQALGAVENAIDDLADDEKKKIDDGAFIAKVFTKGVALVTKALGAGEAGEKFEKYANKAIDWEKGREYKGVEKWQNGLKDGAGQLIDKSMQLSGGNDRALFRERERIMETFFDEGYRKARANRGK